MNERPKSAGVGVLPSVEERLSRLPSSVLQSESSEKERVAEVGAGAALQKDKVKEREREKIRIAA